MPAWVSHLIFLPTLTWNMLLGRWLKVRRWWDRVDDHVILGALPFARDVQRMKADGVTHVINTCEEYPGPQSSYDDAGITQLRLPTVDFNHPSLTNVEQGVEFIQQAASEDGTVYVHCKAGRARSATIVICWLMKSEGLSPQAAQQKILDCRPHANPKLDQRPVVQEFYRLHCREGEAPAEPIGG